jgi:hypothetical protein
MHIEPPEGRIQSFKAFLGHYLMIVLSILTALGLEEWLQHVHHAEAGRAALVQIDAEVRANLGDVRATMADNVRRAKPVDALADAIEAALKAGMPDAKIRREVIEPARKSIQIGVAWTLLRHSAWDVAVADQSAGHIDPGRLGALSELYSAQREFFGGLQSSTILLNGSRLIDSFTDMQVGDVSPRDLLHSLRQLSAAISATQSNLHDMELYLEAAGGDIHAQTRLHRDSAAASAVAAPKD